MRSEKDSLEAVLFDTNTSLEEAEIKRDQLERDNQDLLIKQESYKSQIARLMKDLENCERRSQVNLLLHNLKFKKNCIHVFFAGHKNSVD